MSESHEDWHSCFAQLAPQLLLFARQWTTCHADAEDVVQDAFIRFWKRENRFSPSNRGLLFAAVRSAALDFLRGEGRRRVREDRAAAAGPDFDEPRFESDSRLANEDLARAVERLPAEQREVLILKVWNELTFQEIATVLQISPNTAASRHRYALESLRKELAKDEIQSA